jgi:uncharacterized protein (DUF433 family)
MENRIEIDPKVMVGKPVIKGTRIPVYLILDLLASGKKAEDITAEYPNLSEKDVIAAIEYASSLLKREEIVEVEA